MATAREAVRPAPSATEPSQALFTKLSPGPGMPAAEVAEHQRARLHSAMLEAVAEHGYGAVTVRELSRLSGVSTRAFYQHYSGKEECFLRTHELVVRRVVRRIVGSQTGEHDWRERLELVFAAFMQELDRDPRAARLILVDAYAAGPAALERARRAERTFEMRLADGFDCAPSGTAMSPLLVKGWVAGMVAVARARLLGDREEELSELVDGLTDWALSVPGNFSVEISSPGYREASKKTRGAGEDLELDVVPSPTSNRSLILSSVAKLVASDGHCDLTLRRICAAAGVSRATFKANFSTLDDCLAAAVEQNLGEAIMHAGWARSPAGSQTDQILSVMSALCEQVDSDPVLAKLCLLEVLATSPAGRHCYEQLMGEIDDLLGSDNPVPPARRSRSLALEASVGAIWCLLRHRASNGAPRQNQYAVALTAFALASRGARPVSV